MASYDTMTFQFHSSLQDEDVENDIEDGYHHDHHPHPNNLSVCTSSTICGVDDNMDDVDEGMAMNMSVLSIKGHDDGDADAEFSDGKELSSDSDENDLMGSSSCYPLPATLPRGKGVEHKTKENDPRRKRCRRRVGEKNKSKSKKKDEEEMIKGLSGVRVMITSSKHGRASLCMNLEVPSPLSLSLSNSTLDSYTTSPISSWCISSPGDDPRDVKARLKMWAQAVAASASKYRT